jgi:mRNA-degrading endonuclease RelE of RelBE toxin-antitoxin system
MTAQTSQATRTVTIHSSMLPGLDTLKAKGEKGVFEVIESLKDFSETFVKEKKIKKATASDNQDYYMINAPNDYRIIFTFEGEDIVVFDIFLKQRLAIFTGKAQKTEE